MSVENLSGRTLGRYQLRGLLGTSLMSAVYYGYQTDLERHVAVKVLSPSFVQEPGYIERFTLEAKTVASLEHPHIVPVYDYGVIDGISFVVMRLLTGGTLAQRLDRRLLDNDPLPSLHESAELLRQLASALDYAHSRGVIHRDVKSGNVMFDHQGIAYLVDFGIARLLHRSEAPIEQGIVMGTPSHMAPEQWRNEPSTAATDQYALAVMTYLLVTGKLPFFASTSQGFMHKHLDEAPLPPHLVNDAIPQAVAAVTERALAKVPEDRYQTCTDFARAFADAVQAVSSAPTDFFTFSLSPATVPMKPVTVEPWIQPEEKTIESQPPPVSAPNTSARPDSGLTVAQGPNYFGLGLLGAGIGLLLIAGVVVVALLAYSSLTGGQAITALLELEPENGVTPPSEVIPTLTPVTTQLVLIPTPAVTSIAQSNPTSTLVASSAAAMNPSNAGQVSQIASFLNEGVPVRSVVISRDSRQVASGNGDSTVRLWNIEAGAEAAVLRAHNGVVYDTAYSPDGNLVASAGEDQSVRLWDAFSGALVHDLRGHAGTVRSIAFSPDGSVLASGGEDHAVRRWAVASGAQQAVLDGHTETVLTVAFNSDATLLASGGRDGQIILWNMATGTPQTTLVGHQDEVRAVAFNPSGSILASASLDNTVRLWDVTTGTEAMALREHGTDVFAVAFSPDGSILASGGRDNTVRLWDAQTGQQLAVLQGHGGWVFDVAFSPDGALLASAGGDGMVKLWGL